MADYTIYIVLLFACISMGESLLLTIPSFVLLKLSKSDNAVTKSSLYLRTAVQLFRFYAIFITANLFYIQSDHEWWVLISYYILGFLINYVFASDRTMDLINKSDAEYDYEMSTFISIYSAISSIFCLIFFITIISFRFINLQFIVLPLISLIDKIMVWISGIRFIGKVLEYISYIMMFGFVIEGAKKLFFQTVGLFFLIKKAFFKKD